MVAQGALGSAVLCIFSVEIYGAVLLLGVPNLVGFIVGVQLGRRRWRMTIASDDLGQRHLSALPDTRAHLMYAALAVTRVWGVRRVAG